MAIPARPVAGALLDSAWGGLVHDAIVANDLQAGTLAVAWSASAVSAVAHQTFARPFGAVPVVVIVGGGGAASFNLGMSAITATGFDCQGREVREAATTTTLTCQWLAYGPRA